MSYQKRPPPRPAEDRLVVGIGHHAYVNWSPPADQPRRPVPMTDSGGLPMQNDLADGQEVEILSWLPRAREGVRYQIRRLSDGSEWWLAATYLRKTATRESAEPRATAAAAASGELPR